jgi:response regulator RpfG family c-di-GMP phosphodiesterase
MTKHSILVVDDEEAFLTLMKDLLTGEGFEVVTCVNGKEAAELLERGSSFSVIIADYKMPLMMGTEFLEIAKRWSPHTPRIMITAFQNAKMMEDSINEAEVFRFLTKPVDIDTLMADVRLAIEKFENHVKEEKENKRKDKFIERIKAALEKTPLYNDDSGYDQLIARDIPQVDEGFHPVEMLDMIAALSNALDIINPALNNHHKRTCYIVAPEKPLFFRDRVGI